MIHLNIIGVSIVCMRIGCDSMVLVILLLLILLMINCGDCFGGVYFVNTSILVDSNAEFMGGNGAGYIHYW